MTQGTAALRRPRRRRTKTSYEPIRNRLVAFVVDRAREWNAAHPSSAVRAQGWRASSRALGFSLGTLQAVAWGLARQTTAERVGRALDSLPSSGEAGSK